MEYLKTCLQMGVLLCFIVFPMVLVVIKISDGVSGDTGEVV
jgi:hypothetical protein